MALPSKPTPGPWTTEGFEQITGHGQFYGGLIIGADGETIVAQCIAPHNAQLIADAPQLYELGWNAALEMAAVKLVHDFSKSFGADTCASWAAWLKEQKK